MPRPALRHGQDTLFLALRVAALVHIFHFASPEDDPAAREAEEVARSIWWWEQSAEGVRGDDERGHGRLALQKCRWKGRQRGLKQSTRAKGRRGSS
ncbi:hypothetical protein OH77DRAFT_1428441 [Trametes cingulata]|nr:hypothetical protein OH77DRAFT_1428441 [Trametes cingulata]